MTKTLYKTTSYNLRKLIDDIDIGTIGLPDIQRPFIWKDTKVRDLFDSMYKGYPVGYFLFWETDNNDNAKNIGTEKKQKTPQSLIVDGQQRLTSLYAVIKAKEIIRESFDKDKITISFNPLEEKFEIPDASIKRNPRYFQDISTIWQENANLFKIVNNFITNLQNAVDLRVEEIDKIQSSFQNLSNLQNYNFSAIELSKATNEEQVADIFVRINSKGKQLNQADFILTLMSVFWENGRKDLEKFCYSCKKPIENNISSPFNYLFHPKPDQMLKVAIGLSFKRAVLKFVYNILRGKNLETGVFSEEERNNQFSKLEKSQKKVLDHQNWHEFIKAIKQAGYVKNDYISSDNNLLYSYCLFLIGKEDYQIDLYKLKNLIAKWFFMCCITGRYTSSPESKMEGDFVKLRNVIDGNDFKKLLENIIKNELTNDFWNIALPNHLSSSSANSPSINAYYASLFILDAKGLFSKLKISDLLQEGLKSKKSALEKHHIFPKNYLKKSGINDTKEINQIANYALVEWSDNIKISDEEPTKYLPKYLERISEEDIKNMYYWHALPNGWENMDYKEFLEKRRSNIALVIKDAFNKLSQ
jgi:hypothetical protein